VADGGGKTGGRRQKKRSLLFEQLFSLLNPRPRNGHMNCLKLLQSLRAADSSLLKPATVKTHWPCRMRGKHEAVAGILRRTGSFLRKKAFRSRCHTRGETCPFPIHPDRLAQNSSASCFFENLGVLAMSFRYPGDAQAERRPFG